MSHTPHDPKKNYFQKLQNTSLTFIKFNIVGVINTFVDALIFTICIWLGLHYIASQTLGYSSGMLNSFIWNKKWTFQYKKRMKKQQLFMFIFVNLFTLLLSFIILYIFIDLLDWPIFISKLTAILFTVGFNFWGSRKFVFN